MPSRPLALALAALALGSAGCGDSPESSPPDIASKPAKEILSDVAAAIGELRSYRIEGTQVDEDGRSRLAADFKGSGAMRFSVANGGSRARMIIVGSETYLKGNRAFWLARDASSPERVAALLTDRWVKAPASVAAEAKKQLGFALPKTLARCIERDHGKIRKIGTRMLAGRRVVVIADKGGPGEAPSRLYISAVGSPLPLRELQTGPPRPGKRNPDCNSDDERSTTTKSDIRFSNFNEPMRIAAPASYLDLSKISG